MTHFRILTLAQNKYIMPNGVMIAAYFEKYV
jgi:hypothetical protein